jgi:hypothetical protein
MLLSWWFSRIVPNRPTGSADIDAEAAFGQPVGVGSVFVRFWRVYNIGVLLEMHETNHLAP